MDLCDTTVVSSITVVSCGHLFLGCTRACMAWWTVKAACVACFVLILAIVARNTELSAGASRATMALCALDRLVCGCVCRVALKAVKAFGASETLVCALIRVVCASFAVLISNGACAFRAVKTFVAAISCDSSQFGSEWIVWNLVINWRWHC